MPPSPLAWIAALLLALALGSFLNVCISRLPRHRSIVWPGSHCPRCNAPIRPRDNLPVLSWLLLRGRCRDCRHPIAARYPLVEAGYTALVAASIARFGFSAEGAAAAVFCFLALGLLVMDLETMLLPDSFTLPGLALGLGSAWLAVSHASSSALSAALWSMIVNASTRELSLISSAMAAALWAILLLAIRWSYYAVRRRQGLGLGDVKLAAMLACWLGAPRMAVCFLLAVLGAVVVAVGIGAARYRTRENWTVASWAAHRIPLGAFLCAGGLLSLFFGEQMIMWYASLFP